MRARARERERASEREKRGGEREKEIERERERESERERARESERAHERRSTASTRGIPFLRLFGRDSLAFIGERGIDAAFESAQAFSLRRCSPTQFLGAIPRLAALGTEICMRMRESVRAFRSAV
eukprot:3985495-Pleurochrysis_carterae.AAC.7